MKAKDYKKEREEAFCEDWYMTRNMGKTPTYADAIEWADTHPNWVDRKERLPQIGQFVLVLHNDGDVFTAMTDGLGVVWYAADYTIPTVMTTHWMPLYLPNKD